MVLANAHCLRAPPNGQRPNPHRLQQSKSNVILTLAAWWTEGDKARADNEPRLCYHDDCLCWSPWQPLVPVPLSDCPQKCPRAAADNKPSCGSGYRTDGVSSRSEKTKHRTHSHMNGTYLQFGQRVHISDEVQELTYVLSHTFHRCSCALWITKAGFMCVPCRGVYWQEPGCTIRITIQG